MVPFAISIDYISKGISGFELENNFYQESENFFPTTNLVYNNGDSNKNIYVQIITFNDNKLELGYLDSWIEVKTKKSRGNLDINGNIVFVSGDNKYTFWRSNDYYIQITEIRGVNSINNIKTDETGNFNKEFVAAYLELYPSDCDEINCIKDKEKTFEERYAFDEPEDLNWNVKKHFDTTFFCPKNATIPYIREKMQSIRTKYNEIVSDDESVQFLNECRQDEIFNFVGRPLSPTMQGCYDNLTQFFPEIDLTTHTKLRMDIVRECYVREYFKQRFNGNTIEGYNQSRFDSLIYRRTNEFVDFARMQIEYPMTNVVEEVPADEISENDDGSDMLNISCRPEFGDECLTASAGNLTSSNEPANVTERNEPAIEDRESKIPTKSVLNQIKNSIKSFFKWFS